MTGRILIVILAAASSIVADPAGRQSAPPEVSAPVLLHKTEPAYTDEARSKGIEGVVTLYLEVAKDGAASNIRIIKSLDAGLDANAVQAVKNWRFRPGRKDGNAVTVAATIEVDFKLPKYPLLPSAAPKPPMPSEEAEPDPWPLVLLKNIPLIK